MRSLTSTIVVILTIMGAYWLHAEKATVVPKADELAEPTATLNLNNYHGKYLGYGIGIHASDVSYAKAFDELAPQFVRMEFGPRWDLLEEKIPSGKTVDEYYGYLQRHYNGDSPERTEGARYSHKFLRKRGIKIINIHFELPYHWRSQTGSGQFLSKHIEDLARFHTAHLKFLYKNGVHVDYMELANEPDGVWNGHIPAVDYASLLKRCDLLFEEHGMGKVKILGPGLTFLNLHNNQKAYFDAILKIGPQHLDGWSTHVWDEADFTQSRPEFTYGIWQPFNDRIRAIDPEGKKPVFVTEYASDVTKFGEKSWVSPRERVNDTVVDTWHNAVRVIANSITNLNRGANALVLYRLSDTHWHKTGWGIITPTGDNQFKPKPVYNALVHSLKTLPLNSNILKPTWYVHDDPITLSMLHQASSQQLHILAANSTEHTQVKNIPLSEELTELSVAQISSMIETGDTDATKVSIKDSVLTIELPPLSICRIQLKFKNTEL